MIDPVLASRLQFALTTIVHIIFPVMSMGLAPFLVYFTWKEIRTTESIYERLRRFWTRIFAVSFAVGTVTGIVLEFEFGTNFAAFATAAGELFGGPLAIEGMMAFMLEATFLGIFVFGRERVSDRLYFLSSVAVGVGTWLSAVWILVANSWMQTPRGYEMVVKNGARVVRLTDPLAAYLNPRFLWMFVHMQNAAVLSVALFMAGTAAYYVWLGRDTPFWRKTMKFAVVALLVTAPFQVIHGDSYARHVEDTQPRKFAAMEAQHETTAYADLHLIAFPKSLEGFTNPRAENLWSVSIPSLGSFLASGGDTSEVVTGLNAFDETPPVALVFWSFRIMVALGMWFVGLAFWAAYQWRRGRLFDDGRLHIALMASSVLGIVATEVGWVVTEVGRQPWVIQGVMKTQAGVSPGLTGTEATVTLVGFAGAYATLLGLYTYVIGRIIRNGPPTAENRHQREHEHGGIEVASDD